MSTPDTPAKIGPDITPAQVVAALVALAAACVVLFKLDVSDAQMAAVVGALGIVVPVAWALADAIIRNGRTKVVAAQITADAAVVAASQVPAGAAPVVATPAPRTRVKPAAPTSGNPQPHQ